MSLYEGIKDVASIVQKADNIELYKKILDLQKEVLDIIEENKILKEKIMQLEKNDYLQKNLILKNECYYLNKDNGELDGPYCTTCWDKDKKLIRMTKYRTGSPTKIICNSCGYRARITI